MKITDSQPSTIRSRENRRGVTQRGGASIFFDELNRQEGKQQDTEKQSLKDLRDKLFDAGDRLEQEPSPANLAEFRELIGTFAKKATSMAYRFESMGSYIGSNLGLVSVIDKEVDELLRLVMQGQQARIAIAAKISTIKGLIIKLSA
ncbi:MAG: DUF327 family protein [Geobacter sp.]|nr:MAG: DUF327 family protein [Geobacter sp.]